MTGPVFSITPAVATGPEPVTLTLPPTGYTASAFVTDPCGHPVPGASVTVAGNVATPHGLPVGTSFVDWRVMSDHHAASGGRVALVLASRQTVGGRVTTCTTGPSPYGHHTSQPAAVAAVSHTDALTAGLVVALAVVLAALVLVLWRQRRGHAG